jgi:hypothetical protein
MIRAMFLMINLLKGFGEKDWGKKEGGIGI